LPESGLFGPQKTRKKRHKKGRFCSKLMVGEQKRPSFSAFLSAYFVKNKVEYYKLTKAAESVRMTLRDHIILADD